MIISMKRGATKEQIDHICKRIEEFGYKVHSIEGDERVVIAAVGIGDTSHALESLGSSEFVESAVPISAPYKMVSREVKSDRTVVGVGAGRTVGDGEFAVIAGPCSVETEKQIMSTAELVASEGAKFLRGGAFKPRSSPYDFQGLEEEGLKLLRKAGDATGLAVVTEVMTVTAVDLVADYADMLQIGARNVQNFPLLKEVGRVNRPVLLKRGLSTTIKELLLSAEYIVAHGNSNVILCERGIRTFETATRNTLDIQAVPVLNQMTHLPVILDPAHSSGKRALITPLARASVAVGADGIMVEVHPDPEKAWSDGAQSLTFEEFRTMMREIRPYLELWRQSRENQSKQAA
ncbi:MAG: 3-deoxy-7-phosphoheptulonate synthase [Acidobacteria bacterium]|nr:3-deoxy-7-phosphoheptulonate synthase [Acidobacteriota bacterium]